MEKKINVYKVSFEDFLKYLEKNDIHYKDLGELCALIDSYIIEALRINTKYVN